MDELRAWLALCTVPYCGPATMLNLLQLFPSPIAIFSASRKALFAAGVSQSLVEALKEPDWKQVDICLSWQEKPGRAILHWNDQLYPTLLREIFSPPMVLFVEGHLSVLNTPQVAIVGSRKPTLTGLEIAHKFAHELSLHGFSITSGLASGIDGASHQGCLAANGKTIAVLGSGIDKIYPQHHLRLANNLIEKGGALVSEFFPNLPPKPKNFPRRNRIISGLSVAVIVVEATEKSGSLITARYAIEQGRDVFAVPGSIYNPLSQGCHKLLKEGAALIESTHDVLAELSFSSKLLNKAIESVKVDSFEFANKIDLKPELDYEDIKLVECVGFETTTIDTLAARSGLSADKLFARLVFLEVQGHIIAVPGGYVRK